MDLGLLVALLGAAAIYGSSKTTTPRGATRAPGQTSGRMPIVFQSTPPTAPVTGILAAAPSPVITQAITPPPAPAPPTTTGAVAGATIFQTPSTTTIGTQTLQAAAQLTGAAVLSTTSISALGGAAAIQAAAALTYTPLDQFGNVSTPSAAFVFAGSDGNFYSQGVIGYNANGSPIYAYGKLGSASFAWGNTFFTYAQLQAALPLRKPGS